LSPLASTGCPTKNAPVAGRFFPPAVAWYVVKRAWERPDLVGRSLAQGDSAELARPLLRDGMVEGLSPQTVQRILVHHKRQPWRHPLGRSPQGPREAAGAAPVDEIVTLYTRPLGVWAMVLCVDEKTNLQPHTRKAPTLAAQPGLPGRVEHAYLRQGAVNLLAGFDTRTGTVYATTASRKRQVAFLTFWEHGEREMAPTIPTIPIVRDTVQRHTGKQVQAGLSAPPALCSTFHPSIVPG
jgi:hypothetical protein